MTPLAGTRFVLAAVLLAFSAAAAAHPFHGMGGGAAAGFAHPFTGLDHLLAMFAVGCWAAQLGGRWTAIVPVTFVAVMIGGGALGWAGIAVPLVEPMVAASVLVLGLLVALRARLEAAGVLLVALFALFHGVAHATELPATAPALPYAAGFALATALLHLGGIALGLRMAQAARLAGAPVALAGCWMLFNAI